MIRVKKIVDNIESVFRFDRNTDKLGTGAFGTVYRASHKITGKEVALKIVNKPDLKTPVSKFI